MPDVNDTEHEPRNRAVQCVVCHRPETAWRHDKVCPDCIARASHVAPGTVIAVERPTAAMRSFNGADPDCPSCGGLGRHSGINCSCTRDRRR